MRTAIRASYERRFLPDGAWQPAPPVHGAALVNTGDLMERWTNGRFRSTVHRVRPISGARDRHSIALFVDPDAAVEVECFESCVSADRPCNGTHRDRDYLCQLCGGNAQI